ncbi:hypothetical protein SDC9_74310 [bioreactor metagenome]|uniref:Uncharacterized protein n=1 Tax=bioreactor metagenome TaxID=1076179 RepID=A0A644YH23_9ZZZZ
MYNADGAYSENTYHALGNCQTQAIMLGIPLPSIRLDKNHP